MLAVHTSYRGHGIGTKLVHMSMNAMVESGASEAILETEVDNLGAIGLYESLGFMKDKRLFRYYLSGVDAFRLKLWLNTAPLELVV
jgi:N-alpha-acetyltransferase 30